jgi:diketogulonate reductase-like aldo/keto reductase
MYYNEEEAGKAIRDWLSRTGNPRTSVFFTTKLKSNRDYRTAQREIERSLKKTGLTYIDLFLIHAPFPGKKERLASWKALEDAVDAGIIKFRLSLPIPSPRFSC